MFDLQVYLGYDFEVGLREHIQGVEDGAFSRILNGDDAVVGLFFYNRGEDVGNRWKGLVAYAGAKVFECGLMGISGFGAKVGHESIFL